MPLPHRRAFPDIWIFVPGLRSTCSSIHLADRILFPKGVCHSGSVTPCSSACSGRTFAIPGRPVLEVVAVPVFCEPFPFGGHSQPKPAQSCTQPGDSLDYRFRLSSGHRSKKRSNVFRLPFSSSREGRPHSVHGTSLGLRIYSPNLCRRPRMASDISTCRNEPFRTEECVSIKSCASSDARMLISRFAPSCRNRAFIMRSKHLRELVSRINFASSSFESWRVPDCQASELYRRCSPE